MRKSGNETAESVLKDLDEQHQKYKFMELNLLARKKRYEYVTFVNHFQFLGKFKITLWVNPQVFQPFSFLVGLIPTLQGPSSAVNPSSKGVLRNLIGLHNFVSYS